MEDVLAVYTRPMTRAAPRSAWTRPAGNCWGRSPRRCRSRLGSRPGRTTSTSVVGSATCSWSASRWPAGARSRSATGAPASTGRTPIKDLVEVHYRDAEQIVLVQDNPEHPHAGVAGCGVRAGRGQAAGRQAGAALHPKHGSWLTMAEIELAMLTQQCLDRRLVDFPPRAGHRGYAARGDGSGWSCRCRCSHSSGDR